MFRLSYRIFLNFYAPGTKCFEFLSCLSCPDQNLIIQLKYRIIRIGMHEKRTTPFRTISLDDRKRPTLRRKKNSFEKFRCHVTGDNRLQSPLDASSTAEGGKNANEKCPRAPHTMWIEHSHIPVYKRRGSNTARLALSSVLLFISPFCTHRAHVAFTVNVRSAWQAGNEAGSRGLQRNEGVVVTRTGHCHPRGYRRSKSSPPLPPLPAPCKITLCPGLDGKLLFVRRLRGEFSDNETRSFRTRYGFGPRYSRERGVPRLRYRRSSLSLFLSLSLLLSSALLFCRFG